MSPPLPSRVGPAACLALTAWIFLHPGLELAATYPDYFTHYHCDLLDVVLMVAGIALLPTLLFLAARHHLVDEDQDRLSRLVLALGTGFLLAPWLVKASGIGGPLGVGLGLLLGGTLWTRELRFLQSSWPVPVLVLLALVPPGRFFLTSGIVSHLSEGDLPEVRRTPKLRPPILFVILDELPTATLLAADGTVDAALFPNLASLSRDATWYRNATSVHAYTKGGVPGILTGTYPDRPRLPRYNQYPANLLRILDGAYRIEAFEGGTSLYESSRGAGSAVYQYRSSRLLSLARDGFTLGKALLVPDPTGSGVLDAARELQFMRAGGMEMDDGERWPRGAEFPMLQGLLQPGEGRLYFLHTTLPHGPYHYAPGGGTYQPYDPAPTVFVQHALPGNRSVRTVKWTDQEWLLRHAYQRHVLQTMCTDQLLGLLVRAARERGIWDQALVILTSDHGNRFQPGEYPRILSSEDPSSLAEILAVPLFVKLPGQTEGKIVDAPVQTVDVVPTVAEVLGLELPTPVDGRSLLGDLPAERERRAYQIDHSEVRFQLGVESILAARAEKRAWFDSTAPGGIWPYRLAPVGHLVGSPAPPEDAPRVRGFFQVVDNRPFSRGGLEGLLGEIEVEALPPGWENPPFLAAIHQGKIVGVSRAVGEVPGRSRFLILFPPRAETRPEEYRLCLLRPSGEMAWLPGASSGSGPPTPSQPAHQ